MPDRLTPAVRRLVLASAAVAAILLYFGANSIPAAARGALPLVQVVAQADTKTVADPAPAPDARTGTGTDTPSMPSRDPKAGNGTDAGRGVDLTIDKGAPTDRAKRRKRVVMGDREFDSFEQMMQEAPWIAGMVFGVVSVVFLVPVLLVALFIWYRLRKNRMLNETLIKLAERGVVPPADALDALTSNRQAAAVSAATVATTGPLLERARLLRKGAAWSDLRKGVIMAAIGLGFTFYALFDEGGASWLGLVLLFVGIGYCGLWYFEDQQIARTRDSGIPPAGGA